MPYEPTHVSAVQIHTYTFLGHTKEKKKKRDREQVTLKGQKLERKMRTSSDMS